VKQVLLFILLLIILAVGYLVGAHGPDPTQWFAPPTPTPTFTATPTSTPVFTATPTATLTPIPPTMTPTPVPKKKAVKKPAKKHVKKHAKENIQEVTDDSNDELADPPEKKPAGPPPPEPPERKPICNAPTLPSAVMELEPNNTFIAAQNLGALLSGGLQVNGTLLKVVQAVDTTAADVYRVDPKVENADLDIDVYAFTSSSPFLAVLDCYTHVVGRPIPLYHENNFQLEIYNETFELVGRSAQNDPVESLEIAGSGNKFYAVVYGVDGTDGAPYRLTLTRKESE
jgi:hypothetical protein